MHETVLPVVDADCEQCSSDGVIKWALRFEDGARIETVAIPGHGRTTLCVSSQVGCPVACSFCATGRMGLQRNLTAAEIVAQYRFALAYQRRHPQRLPRALANLVFMGMGEPFLNYDPVCAALEELIRDHGFHSRIITLSTIGVPHRIVDFARRFPRVRLAVSLHHADDGARTRLVPLNARHDLDAVLDACREYQRICSKKVFFEYVLIRGDNDSPELARSLARRLADLDATVNLIPLHPGGVSAATAPDRESVELFRAALKEDFRGHVTFRRSRGLDIDAACGQLVTRADRSAGISRAR